MYTCGIDVHKLILQIAIVDKYGRVVHKEVCKYTPERIIALAYKLLKYQCKLIAMERNFSTLRRGIQHIDKLFNRSLTFIYITAEKDK